MRIAKDVPRKATTVASSGSNAQERGRVAPAAVGWRCHAPGGPVAEELGTAIQRQLV